MKMKLEEAIEGRRSIRTLEKGEHIGRKKIEEILKVARHAPNSYNMQGSRVVVLFDGESDQFWDITRDELRKVTPPDGFARTEKKLYGFRSGNGTLLFYEDMDLVEQMKENFPLYADKFDHWAQQNNAIFQYAVWLELYANDIAASLQHYNPLVDDAVAKRWDIPDEWLMIAQMPFGKAAEEPAPRSFKPLDEIVRFYE